MNTYLACAILAMGALCIGEGILIAGRQQRQMQWTEQLLGALGVKVAAVPSKSAPRTDGSGEQPRTFWQRLRAIDQPVMAAEAHVMAYEHTHPEPDDQPVMADPETPDVVEGLAGEVIAHDPGPVTEPEMPAQPGPETVPMHAAFNDSAAELDGRIADIELARALAELEDRVWGWRQSRETVA